MELLLNTQEERCRMEVYNEYLKKIPELLVQLETVEEMYEKALLEEKMLQEKDAENVSVNLYSERIARIKRQCEERAADIRQQCRLIMELKAQIENESSALRALPAELHPRIRDSDATLTTILKAGPSKSNNILALLSFLKSDRVI